MVRTKADRVPTKAVGSKAPSKTAKSTPTKKAGSSKGKNYSGGNPYHPRETPEWQKPITYFINQNPTPKAEENENEDASKETNKDEDVSKETTNESE